MKRTDLMDNDFAEQLKKEREVSPRLFVTIMGYKYDLGLKLRRKIDFVEGFEHFIDHEYESWSHKESAIIMQRQLADAQAKGLDPLTYAATVAKQFREEINDPTKNLIKIDCFEVTDPTGLHMRPLVTILQLTSSAPNADLYLGRPRRKTESPSWDFTWQNVAFFQIKADNIYRVIEQLAVPKGTQMQAWAWGLESEIDQFFKGLYSNLEIKRIIP
jgi:hypothetical protein